MGKEEAEGLFWATGLIAMWVSILSVIAVHQTLRISYNFVCGFTVVCTVIIMILWYVHIVISQDLQEDE